ncbi:MAG TPA: heavy metal translocating P-type ATPase [Gemmatimonadales bacterium]
MTAGIRPLGVRATVAPLATLLLILTGLALQARPSHIWDPRIWSYGLIVVGLPVVWRTVVGALRGQFAADLVATLAIITAVALRQPLPGLVVVLMQTGGEALERYTAGRASRAVQELEAAAPRRANRLRASGVEEIPAEQVRRGDMLLVRAGEMVPCDGVVTEGYSHVDQSRLTGEPAPVTAEPGISLMSGSLNLEGPLTVRVRAIASESQYERIVQLVRTAEGSKSPLQRMADRYAVVFTPITLLVCGLAYFASHDPLRVLAVLVVATPCPLILAAPVAMIGGINRAARRSVIIRHGEALERLGQATVALLDKTGTLTIGRPTVTSVAPVPPFGEDEILAYAAAVDAGASHMLARSIVAIAAERRLTVPPATGVVESPGAGVTGRVGGHEITLGARSFVWGRHPDLMQAWKTDQATGLRAWLAVDGAPGGVIEFADRLRPEARRFVLALLELGFRRVILVTGDHLGHARAVANDAGIREVRADLLPADKVRVVEELERKGERVLMVGDGTNDAPALTRASVGVAIAAHGGGITAEAADAVVLADDAARVAEVVAISKRTMRIAKQSIWAGLGLSGLAMVVAAFGYIPPTIGAVLQEIIDVAVILNAVRASGE